MARKRISLAATSEGMSLKEGYEQFIKEKRAMNVSPDTVDYYGYCFKYFSEYLGENALCRDINAETILGYLLHLRE